ncbi:unnamed protein product [Protopolystoma xenopodis]|uniref:Uncharacterized protein n=1 Tax=Protopolystoma xenopodis TaxID=117903 RepID=A0A448XQC7_9PLAT|nr:unnamed protein product [Protopolystoma xenopodis]
MSFLPPPKGASSSAQPVSGGYSHQHHSVGSGSTSWQPSDYRRPGRSPRDQVTQKPEVEIPRTKRSLNPQALLATVDCRQVNIRSVVKAGKPGYDLMGRRLIPPFLKSCTREKGGAPVSSPATGSDRASMGFIGQVDQKSGTTTLLNGPVAARSLMAWQHVGRGR